MRHLLESSFLHALKYTSPRLLVQKHLPKEKPSLILAVGKAAIPMLGGALAVFPDAPYLVTPPLEIEREKGRKGARGISSPAPLPPFSPAVSPGTHPIPSQHSVTAAEKALELASQLSENKDLKAVFDDLFDADGSEIYVKPATDYVNAGTPVNFYTLCESAARKGEIAIGYRINEFSHNVDKAYGVSVNPKKSDMVTFTDKDKLIVIAED